MYIVYLIFIVVMAVSFITGLVLTVVEHKLQKKLKEENPALPRMDDEII